jgi:hypothetical protein
MKKIKKYKEGEDSFTCPICRIEIRYEGKLDKIHSDCIKYMEEHPILHHTKIDTFKLDNKDENPNK